MYCVFSARKMYAYLCYRVCKNMGSTTRGIPTVTATCTESVGRKDTRNTGRLYLVRMVAATSGTVVSFVSVCSSLFRVIVSLFYRSSPCSVTELRFDILTLPGGPWNARALSIRTPRTCFPDTHVSGQAARDAFPRRDLYSARPIVEKYYLSYRRTSIIHVVNTH